MKLVLRCKTAQGLKLGPNSEIVFKSGFATVDTDMYPDWERWAMHPGTPPVENFGADDDPAPAPPTAKKTVKASSPTEGV